MSYKVILIFFLSDRIIYQQTNNIILKQIYCKIEQDLVMITTVYYKFYSITLVTAKIVKQRTKIFKLENL